jgi:hypothetical protein
MTRDMRPEDDRELQQSLQGLADLFERQAVSEEAVSAQLERQLAGTTRRRMAGAIALGVTVVAVLALGLRALNQPAVGGPAPMPEVTGIFVTTEPDPQGSCYAVRLYDTTSDDGRVALWTWAAGSDCTERTGSISTGIGRAEGVRLLSGGGILIRAAADIAPPLSGLELVLDVAGGADGSIQAFTSLEAAANGQGGMRMTPTERLIIPLRPQ